MSENENGAGSGSTTIMPEAVAPAAQSNATAPGR
jgi:hypothetical protein